MTLSFALIIGSAVFHSGWNVLVKLSKDKLAFTVHIHLMSSIYMTVIMLTFFRADLYFDKPTFMYALISSFFFAFYQVFVASAYKYADVSMVYPVTTSSPLFIIIWAYFLLGERITAAGFIGILLILSGCYIMNMTKGDNKFALRGFMLALAAAVMYSFGAMGDKMGVTQVNTILYIYLMTVFLTMYTAIMVSVAHIRTKRAPIEWRLVLIGGLVLSLSTILYRLGLVDMPISYAAALRQVSSFFGLMMGIFFFKESYGLKRAVGCAVIISGIVLIRLGM